MKRAVEFVLNHSLLLLIGALVALAWANLDGTGYSALANAMRVPVNDIAMVFFFGLATKEVFEAMLPGGPLSSPREGALPLLAACGGMIVPASIYLVSIRALDMPELHAGWAIPCATDIAFSYLAARLIFPANSPAIPFLLLLAIADDALGLLVLAIFYPSGVVSLTLLAGLLLPGMALAWIMRRAGIESFWLYIAGPGLLSWLGLHYGGLHPALALVPIVPFMPHRRVAVKVFGQSAPKTMSTLQSFEQWWKAPAQFVLLAFGLVNAGVPFSAVGPISWVVAISLVIGKPIGVVGTTLIAELIGFRRSAGLDYRSLVTLGVAAGIGFTVALFFVSASNLPSPAFEQAKMGALFSFGAGFVAIAVGRALGLRPTP